MIRRSTKPARAARAPRSRPSAPRTRRGTRLADERREDHQPADQRRLAQQARKTSVPRRVGRRRAARRGRRGRRSGRAMARAQPWNTVGGALQLGAGVLAEPVRASRRPSSSETLLLPAQDPLRALVGSQTCSRLSAWRAMRGSRSGVRRPHHQPDQVEHRDRLVRVEVERPAAHVHPRRPLPEQQVRRRCPRRRGSPCWASRRSDLRRSPRSSVSRVPGMMWSRCGSAWPKMLAVRAAAIGMVVGGVAAGQDVGARLRGGVRIVAVEGERLVERRRVLLAVRRQARGHGDRLELAVRTGGVEHAPRSPGCSTRRPGSASPSRG